MSETTDTSADAKAAQSIYSPLIHQKAIPFNSIQLRCQSQARKLIDLHCRTICSRQTFFFLFRQTATAAPHHFCHFMYNLMTAMQFRY